MKVSKKKDFRENPDKLESRLIAARKELMDVRAQLSSGGSIGDPTKPRELKKEIAALLTIKHELENN